MIALDRFDPEVLSVGNAEKRLGEEEAAEYLAIPPEERERQLSALLTKPIDSFTMVNELYFRSKWAALFRLTGGERPLTLLEVASGDADMVPQALARANPGSTYIAANENQSLSRSLVEKTQSLKLRFHLVEDDASRIGRYIPAKSVDIVAFQHGVNDVLQGILCAQNGIDTIHSDWMETLPAMISLLKEETEAGTLEAHVKSPFLALMHRLAPTMKDDGVIAISHYMFQLDLDWGYPPALHENIVPMVRAWLASDASFREIGFPGFEPQWWLFLRKS